MRKMLDLGLIARLRVRANLRDCTWGLVSFRARPVSGTKTTTQCMEIRHHPLACVGMEAWVDSGHDTRLTALP